MHCCIVHLNTCIGQMIYVFVQASRDALLNRSPEYAAARLQTFHNTTAVYDLLTLTLVRRARFSMLSEVGNSNVKVSLHSKVKVNTAHPYTSATGSQGVKDTVMSKVKVN